MMNLVIKTVRILSVASLVGFLVHTPLAGQEKVTDILDLPYKDAVISLRGMALHGNMRDKLDGGAWMVLSTIATGFGRADCGLEGGEKWLFYPALDILTKEQAFELNRLVTANFRNAQYGPDDTETDVNKLYPISRAAYEYLTTIYTKPLKRGMRIGIKVDCAKVRDVWEHARSYMQNKSLRSDN
jgi:hypothetical protein